MNVVVFDTPTLARKQEAAGFTGTQAQGAHSALSEAMSEVGRLTIQLGGMVAASVAIAAALVKLP